MGGREKRDKEEAEWCQKIVGKKSGREKRKIERKESKRVSGMRDSLPGPEHIEGSRWKSGTVN